MLVLKAEHLVKIYKGRTVVNDVSVQVSQGEIVGLLGPNGAGKTTSFYMTVGLIPPDKGRVFLGDKDITDLAMYKRAQQGVGYLPQEASVFRTLSVEDNIMAVLEMTKLTKPQQKERLELLLEEFGLNRVRTSMGNVLSGGERRRTEIARALATDPKFILLDEPFAGIDPIAVEDIQRIVEKLKKRNIGVLITDHNVQETLSITDRAYLLFEGKILKSGSAEELAADETVRRVYLGQNFELRRKKASENDRLNDRKEEINPESLIRYTNKLLVMIENLFGVVSKVNPNAIRNELVAGGFNDFSQALSEYKKMVGDFASSESNKTLADIVQSISPEFIKERSLIMEFVQDRFMPRTGVIDKYETCLRESQRILNQVNMALKHSAVASK